MNLLVPLRPQKLSMVWCIIVAGVFFVAFVAFKVVINFRFGEEAIGKAGSGERSWSRKQLEKCYCKE